jgi:FKBP-type peptidyl-prolyl cis-trans isomerase FkpA
MNKIAVFVLASVLVLTGCLKKEEGCPYPMTNVVAPASEEAQVREYVTANNIDAVKHSSNLYYEILEQGTGKTPELCSQIRVNYTGKLTNGNTFDSNPSAVFVLGSLIEGWKKGIPLIKGGGRIRLYIPPTLGYGSQDIKDQNNNVIIPGNSILIFDLTLIEVQ